MIEELLKDIFVIKVPLPKNPLKNLNSYFVKGIERNLLIDTGFNTKDCYDALTFGLKKLNADMKKTDIFLTHLHSDHTGLSKSIASDHTKIFIGEKDREIMVKFFSPRYWDQLDDRYFSLGLSREELAENRKTNPASNHLPSGKDGYTGVKNGFVFDLGNYKLRCIETPGHTPGHMCLYNEEHKLLFSGDHIIFDITPNITSWPNVEDSLGLYLDSLVRIKALKIKYTFSSHRRAMGDSHDRIDELIQHHNDRIAEAEGIIKAADGLTPYQVASQMTWSIKAQNWAEFPVAQKWFAVGEASSHLEHLRKKSIAKRQLKNKQYVYFI